MRSMYGVLLLAALAGCDGPNDVDSDSQAGGVNSKDLHNRWYGVDHLNRINFYVGYLSNQQLAGRLGLSIPEDGHLQATLDAFLSYNSLTALDFVPAPTVERNGFEVPDPDDPEPHVVYIDCAAFSDWVSHTLTFTTLREEAKGPPSSTQSEHQAIFTLLVDELGAIRKGKMMPNGRFRHDDFLVAYKGGDFANDHVGLHETGHVLGFGHEQNRVDACNAIEIFPKCIQKSLKSQFKTNDDFTLLSPYDLNSVMQYGSAFAQTSPTCFTMLARNQPNPTPNPATDRCTNSSNLGTVFGQASVLSKEDINSVFEMYPNALGADAPGNDFGHSMVAADFDGDGYVDLAVGAPGESAHGGPASGVVVLYKGTFTGLIPWRIIGEAGVGRADGDRFGESLAAGDFFSHGKADLIVGAPGRTVAGKKNGAVYLYQTNGTRFDAWSRVTAADSATAASGNDRFGHLVAAGDFDGDGQPELVVGALNAQLVYVFKGQGTRATPTWSDYVPAIGGARLTGDKFGAAIATGDLNADGADDLAIGAPAIAPGAGTVTVFPGVLAADGGGFRHVPVIDEPSPSAGGDEFGASIVIGHFDSRQTPNGALVVGAPGHTHEQGRVFVFEVGVTPAGSKSRSLSEFGVPNQRGARFGGRLLAGDINGDHIDDLVVGIPSESEPGLTGAGLIATFLGRTLASQQRLRPGSLTGTPNAHGNAAPGDNFGFAMAIGDFDLKSSEFSVIDSGVGGSVIEPVNDLAVSTPGRGNGAGAVWVHQGIPVTGPSFPADETTFTGFLTRAPGNLDLYRR